MKRNFSKRSLSLAMTVLMLLSMMTVPVSAGNDIPATGVILFDDFENYGADGPVGCVSDGDGPWTRRLAYVGAQNGNQFWEINCDPYEDYTDHLLFELSAAGYNQNQINTGKLLYEYDLYFPDAGTLASDVKAGHYLATYSSDWEENSANSNRAFLAYSQYTNDKAEIWFPTTSVGSSQGSPLENSQALSFDTWHRISHLINYDNGTVDHYVDGKYVDSFAGGANNVQKYYHFTEMDLYINGKNLTSDTPNVYMDNVKIERPSGNEPFTVSISEVGADYIDLSFDRTADLSALTAADFNLKVFNGETIGTPASITVDGMTVRLGYASIPSGASYELYINREIPETLNSASVIPYGKKLSFTTGTATADTVLLDQNFESVTWPAEGDGTRDASFVDIYKSYMPDESDTNPSAYGQTSTWKYQKENNEDTYIKSMTHNGSTMLRIDHNQAMSLAEGGLDLLFPLSKPVSNGTLEISFDVLKNSSGAQRLSFGLHDTSYTGEVKFDPMTSWSGSTLFGGYTIWSGRRQSIVTNYAENRTQTPDGYANAKNASNNPGLGTWTNVTSAALITDNYTTSETLESNVIHAWRFVIDLDNKKYEVYLDGDLKKTMNFIPGGGANGVYDAFTVNLMQTTTAASIAAATDRNVLLDNIKVTAKEPVPLVTGVTFEKYDGREYGHSAVLSAGTKKAVVSFSKEMDAASFSNITVTDEKNTAYTVTKDGNNAVITFSNCLSANTAYTITIGADVADMNGTALGGATELTFTTDAGEKMIGNPVLKSSGSVLNTAGNITSGQSLTAEATIINTTGEAQDAHIFVASYKNSMLAGVQQNTLSASDQYERTIQVNFAADEGFVDADEIKIFLFNNLTDVKPLTRATVIGGDSSANVALSSAVPEGFLMTASVPANVTPAVETTAGKTGWKINPEEINESYIKVDVDDSFLHDLKPEDTVTVTVDYYNDSYSGFSLLYNDKNGEIQSQFLQMTGENAPSWETATFTLYDAAFDESSALYGDDFRIITNDAEFATDEKVFMGEAFDPVLIGGISVRKDSTKSPFIITAETGKTGNIFFDNDPLSFTINLTDVSSTGAYTDGSLTYTIYNHAGTRLWSDVLSFTGNTASITLPEQPFGVYTMEITVEYDDVYQTKIIDFSRSLKATEVNKQFGTCLHMGWEVYSMEDIKNLLDLVKASGYGIARSGGVTWYEIEPDGDGNYVIPERVQYAHQYTHELGIDGQILLGHEHPHYAEYDHPTYYYWLTKPENREAYAKYCAYVVDEMSEYVEYFGISGEFNLQGPGGWHPFDAYWSNHNADNYIHYYNLVKDSYDAITTANPDAVMINGIVARYEDEWIQECFDLGIMDYSDGFAIDIYDFVARPEYKETLATPISQFYDQVKTEDATKAAWITENGWPTREVSFAHQMEVHMATEEEQARWYARAMAMYSDKDKIDKFMFYAFINNNTGYFWQEYNFGVIRAHDYRTPFAAKPAFVSTAAFNTIVGEAAFYGDQNTGDTGYYDYKFVNDAGEEIMMIWCEETVAAKDYTYTSSKPYLEIYDLYGNKTTVANTGSYTVAMGANPIYIKGVDSIA